MILNAWPYTEIGDRSRNDDRLVAHVTDTCALCGVADGLGGHDGGDVAAAICIATVEKEFLKAPSLSTEKLLDVVSMADQAIAV
ncbi:protein phosphatase 2C domain-containing protein, partial [Azospirillum sp. B4]|uniref:protein phosphatase 2C domain-containing protein n=1 Tax=Azospirillum sp. B4 TaxID=95605 RepID=UPI0005C975CE